MPRLLRERGRSEELLTHDNRGVLHVADLAGFVRLLHPAQAGGGVGTIVEQIGRKPGSGMRGVIGDGPIVRDGFGVMQIYGCRARRVALAAYDPAPHDTAATDRPSGQAW